MTNTAAKPPAEQALPSGRDFLKHYIKLQQRPLYLAVLAGSLATVCLIAQWLCFASLAHQTLVDGIAIYANIKLLSGFAGALLAQSLLIRVQSHFSHHASEQVRNAIRLSILDKWRSMSPIELHKRSAGALATQWVEDVEAMDGYFARYWPQQMLAIISPLLILCAVAYFNWLCALLLLISAPLIPLFMVLVGMGAEKLNEKYASVRQRLAGHFLDRISHLSTIRLLGAEPQVLEEVNIRSHHYRDVIMKTLKVAFLSSTVLEFFTSVAIASLAIYIGFSLYGAITWGPAGSLSLFTGLGILILAPEFFQPLRNLSQFYHDRAAALGATTHLITLLYEDQTNTVLPAQGSQKPPLVNYHLGNEASNAAFNTASNIAPEVTPNKLKQHSFTMTHLSVGFDASKPLAKALNMTLTSGQMLAISGHSGCGKTTLLNTLAGYIPALAGEFDLDGKPVDAMAYLPQKAWIKNASVYQNIIALAPQASRHQVFDVMQKLGLSDELVHQHNGLDTLIGEHGQGMSGGQIQRIALARILLNPAPLVLLDEPSAKLDVESKGYILQALQSLKASSIIIAVTHDPAVIDMADMHINLQASTEGEHATVV